MTEQQVEQAESTAIPPILFTTPANRPLLDREVLSTLHEGNTPLDVDALHQELNSDRSRPHVARGPLEALLKELVTANKIQEVPFGTPAHTHFILANEVRVSLDGSWQRAKALAAVIAALGEPSNKSTIWGLSTALFLAANRTEDSLPIPTPYLTAVFTQVDPNSPEAVDAWVAVQLDTLIRNGQALMTGVVMPVEPALADVPADGSEGGEDVETTTTDDVGVGGGEGTNDVAADEGAEAASVPTEPNLHENEFSLHPSAWERVILDGALAVAIDGVPELVQQKRDQSDATRELRAELDKAKKDAEVAKAIADQQRADLSAENNRLRTSAAKFTAFCEENNIDFALVVSGPKKERLRETHVVSGTLTTNALRGFINEWDKAKRYLSILEERVKDRNTQGKADVKEAAARVVALEQIIALADNSEFQFEKQCVKYLKDGVLVWESDEPHDQGRIVDTQHIATHEAAQKKKEGKEGKEGKAKPTQFVVPGTATNPREVEWLPGDKAVTTPDVNADALSQDTTNTEPNDESDGSDEDGEDEENDEDEDNDASNDAGAQSPNSDAPDANTDDASTEPTTADTLKPTYTPPTLTSVDQASAKTFILDYVTAMGRSTTKAIGVAYATALGTADKPRVAEFGEKIVEQLVGDGRFESEKVGTSVFVWIKTDGAPVAAEPAKAKRGRKPKNPG